MDKIFSTPRSAFICGIGIGLAIGFAVSTSDQAALTAAIQQSLPAIMEMFQQ